jgi:hypothetical protein
MQLFIGVITSVEISCYVYYLVLSPYIFFTSTFYKYSVSDAFATILHKCVSVAKCVSESNSSTDKLWMVLNAFDIGEFYNSLYTESRFG